MGNIKCFIIFILLLSERYFLAPPKAAEPVDVEKMKKLREQELEKAAVAAKAAAEAEAIATVSFA